MMHMLLAPSPRDCPMTLCPAPPQPPKPENFLKTKGPKRDFSSAKPDNILKISQLEETI
jgi:hypothetical protein